MWCSRNILYFIVITGVCVVTEKKSFNQIDTKVIPDDGSFFLAAIRKLEEVRSEMKAEQRLITVASKPAELLPTIGSTLSAGLQYIGQTYGTNEGKWIHLMLNKIMEAAESTSVRTQYDSIRISAKTIGQLFQQMQSATPEDQNSITLDINTKLLDIFNTFHISENAFKKYPHLAIPTLLELTPLMFVVEQLFKLKKTDLLEKWFYSCRLVDLLKKYRTLVLFYRMPGLSVPYSSAMVEIQPNQPPFRHISNVLRKPFNRYGYNETNRDYMECHTFGHCKKHGMKIDKCFEDERIGVEISAVTYEVIGEGFYFDNTCVQQYVELLRLRVEQTFQGSIDILEEGLCTADRRAKRDSTDFLENFNRMEPIRAQKDVLRRNFPTFSIFRDFLGNSMELYFSIFLLEYVSVSTWIYSETSFVNFSYHNIGKFSSKTKIVIRFIIE